MGEKVRPLHGTQRAVTSSLHQQSDGGGLMSMTVCVDAEGGAVVQHCGFDPKMTVSVSVNRLNGEEELLSRHILSVLPKISISKISFQESQHKCPANSLVCSDDP